MMFLIYLTLLLKMTNLSFQCSQGELQYSGHAALAVCALFVKHYVGNLAPLPFAHLSPNVPEETGGSKSKSNMGNQLYVAVVIQPFDSFNITELKS